MPDEKPKFDPNKKFEPVQGNASSKPAFNPDADYEPLKKKVESKPSLSGQKTPFESFQAGLATSQSASPSGLRSASIIPEPITGVPLKPVSKKVEMPLGIKTNQLEGFDVRSKLSSDNNIDAPADVAFQTGEITGKNLAGIKGGTQDQINKNTVKYETVNLQKELKAKGYEVEVSGNPNDEKTVLALNFEQDKAKVAQKEAFKQADFYKQVDRLLDKDKSFFSEEKLVPYLTDKFGKQDYVFEESNPGSNEVTVSYTPDGQNEVKSESFDISPEGIQAMQDFLKQTNLTGEEQKVVSGQTGLSPEDYQNKMVELMVSNPYKYGKELIDKDYFENIVTDRTLDLRVSAKDFEIMSADLEQRIKRYNENPTEQEGVALNMEIENLKKIQSSVFDKARSLEEIQKNYEKATGFYVAQKAEQGNFLGLIQGGLAKGLTSIPKLMTSSVLGVIPSALGIDASIDPITKSKLEYLGYTEDEMKDYVVKESKRYFMPRLEEGIQNVSTAGTTTQEYAQSGDRNEFEKVVSMLSESLGAAAAGGGNPMLAKMSFFAMSYNSISSEMQGTDFDDLSENKKLLISVPYGLTIGALEELGFKFSTGAAKSPFLNKITKSIIAKTFSSIPKNASIDVIEETIRRNTATLVADGTLKIVGGALVEGTTEAVQKIDEVAIKNIANSVLEKDYFDVPDITTMEGVKETIGLALEDGKYGFYGGLIMAGGPTALGAIKSNFDNKKSNEEFSVFLENMMDDKLFNISLNEINRKLESDEITETQANQQVNALNTARETAQSIPSDLSVADKRRSFDLINERRKIEEEIEGKDPNLVSKQIEKINGINERLKVIGGEDVQSEESTETSTEQENSTPEKPTETAQQPNVIQEEGLATEYTDPEGKFYSEKEVLEMNPEQRSSLTLQNPSVEVMNAVQPMPEANTATETNAAPTTANSPQLETTESNTSNSRELETPVQSEPVAITKPSEVTVGQTLVDIEGKESVVTAIDGNTIVMDRDGSEFRANPKVVELFTKPEATISKTETVQESVPVEDNSTTEQPIESANNATVQNESPAGKPVRTKAEIESEQEKLFTRAMGLKQNEYDRLIAEGLSEVDARKQASEFAENLPEAKRYDELNDEINSLPENNPAQETFSEQSNITEETDNTVQNTDGINNEADLGNTDTSSESKPAPEKQEKSSEKKPEKKVSKQADRFSEMQDKETSKRIKELASYDVQNQEEFSSAMDEIINTLGVDGAVDYVNDLDNEVAPEVRIAILTEAGASISQDAMEAKAKALKSQDLEALRQADAMLEKGMRLIVEASLYKTKAGQINSYTRKTYSKYPSVFQVELTEKFNRSYGATEQVRKDVSEVRDGIQEGLSGIVDDVFSDQYVLERMQEEIDDLRSQISNLESRQNEKQNKREEKVRNARKKFEAAKARFKGTSQTSGSIAFLSSEQIEAIGDMVFALIEMGYANTNRIVSEIYEAIKSTVPNARKEHIRQAALNINEFNVMQQSERQQARETRIDKLRQKLADLQKGKENISETIQEDDSDEIKALKQQIADEKVLTPKIIKQLVKDFLAGKTPNVASLAQALAEKTGKSEQEMQDMADIIQETLNARIEDLVAKEHDKFIDRQNKRKESTESLRRARREGTITDEQLAELEERIEGTRTRKEIEQIMALLRSGRLNDTNEFTRAFEKRFGFRQLPTHVKAQLDAIAFQIFEMEKQVQKEIIDANGDVRVITIARKEQIGRLQKQFNTLLESSKPWTVARVLKEIVSAQYVNMLSGPLTFVRAFYGGYSSGAFGALSYTVRNIATNPKAVFNGIIAAWRSLPSAYRRAVQSRKTGYDLFGQSSLKGETDGVSMGWYEKTMLTGLQEALDNKQYGKAALKTVGQILKGIHALGALDAFMNTVSGAYIGTIQQSKQGKYDAVLNETLDQDYRSIAEEEFQESTKRIQDFVEANFPNLTTEQKYDKVNSLMKSEMGLTGSRLNAKKTYMINRVQELREQALGDLFVEGVQLAKDASMMGTPDGYAGLLVEKYLKPSLNIKDDDSAGVAVGKFFLNAIFKFVRITGQLINKTFNNIPVLGIANAFIGPGYNPKTGEFDTRIFKGKINSNPELLKQRIFNNVLITSMTVAGFLMMFEDDDDEGWKLKEDRSFDLRSFGKGGQGGKYANERKYEDFQNLSISFSRGKNGKFDNYISFKLNPEISAVLATLGSFADLLRGDATDKQLRSFEVSPYKTAFWKAIGDNAKIFTESSFSSIGRIVKNIQGEENFFEGLGTAGQNLLIDNARPLINPASLQSITKAVESSAGENQKETKGWQYLANNLYGLDGFINDEKTDVFGNKFPEENDYGRFMKEFVGEGEKRSETIKNTGLLYKFDEGLNISKRKFSEMLPTAPKGFSVTYNGVFGKSTEKYFVNDDKISVEAQNIQETEFNRLVNENYKYLNSLETKEDLESKMKELQTESVDFAKKTIVDKYEKTKKIQIQE